MKPFLGGLKKSNKRNANAFHQGDIVPVLDTFRTTLEFASKKIFILEETLEALVKERLNIKQMELLLKIEENEGLFYYKLIKKLSKEMGLPESTVRWNLNRLRDAKMVITGDKNNKRVPVKLTENGKLIVSAFKNRKIGKKQSSSKNR